ncbi:interleukin-1 receptor-like 2 isoform X2 [Lepus europaeus]|uniref:interleukin-1 receptor-like 2 isoform X2 n=1 Tax=Lepus europaeus TaxID=9983 RepID=UPI002B49F42D|nr:interleukin-1 receptor-like 2 isoform X2 [Lepus europaeus]
MGMRCLLVCGVSIALPLFVGADVCKEIGMQNETPSVGQPFAFNCTFPPITFGKVNVLWYKSSRKIPVSQNVHSRIHQDHTWILFLPLAWEDSGIYQCIIEETDHCYRIHINLTVAKRSWCDNSGTSVSTLSDEYKQILHVGQDDSLMCHLHFPKSCVLDSIKWYKDCKEIERERFTSLGLKLSVSNVSAEDRGNYACMARLTHLGKEYTVLNSITVNITERVGNGGRIPKIIYPKNNSIEVQLGSALIVDCNITDTKENTNLRCWRVNNTLVDDYYSESKRVREGIEAPVSFQDHTFYTVNITFLEVKMEDYGLPFVCHAGVSAAYIILTLPAPDFRAYLIGGLTALTVVILSLTGVYNIFKIDIVLWYRSTFHPNGTAEAVASVIDENIKLCRRLMVIVVPESPSFSMLKNMSEEQIAVYNALIQDGMKVILIELEKIEDYTAMPESIQYIKQKHGAIQWSGGFTEQSQVATAKFWKKVRYHMPPKRYPPSPPVQPLKHTPCHCAPGTWETSMGLITH